MAISGGWRRFLLLTGVGLLGMVLGVLLLASLMAGEIYDYQDTVDGVHLPAVDAIVVLAGGRGRISAAGDLWYRYWDMTHSVKPGRSLILNTPALYVSGMGHQATWNVFARQLRRGVLEVIRPDNVVIEKVSTNTEENARWLVKYARDRGWSRILLVTSSYHMKRARMVFERVFQAGGMPLALETLSIFQDPFEPGEWRTSLMGIRVTLLEYLKGIYYQHLWTPGTPGTPGPSN